MTNIKHPLQIALCLGLLTASLFYLLTTAAGDGTPVIAEPDALLYYHYARNIAAGNPYVFSPGDAPSTGSTTHLFPYILAIPYLLGVQGNAIVLVSYILNCCFYLTTIWLAWLMARKMAPGALWLIMLMVALSGHLASACLRQTDIGFFSMLAMALFACLLYERWKLGFLFALLCAVTRPEGFVFAIAFFICGTAALVFNRRYADAPGSVKQGRYFLGYGLTAAVAFFATLLINQVLTGHLQFMSVANKGYFKIFPLSGAMLKTMTDALALLKGFFLGVSNDGRQFFVLPFIAGALGLFGILTYPRESKQIRLFECWLALGVGASILLIASSQWQGVSNDRYLGWIMPLWIIYIAIGVHEAGNRIKAKYYLPIISCLLVGYQTVSLAFIAQDVYTVAVEQEKEKVFAEQIAEQIPPTKTIGTDSGAGLSYYLPQHKIYNLSGITSPDFFDPDSRQQVPYVFELAKHHPELRFDYWMIPLNIAEQAGYLEPFIGDMVLMNANSAIGNRNSLAVFDAHWTTVEGGDLPVLRPETAQLSLVDSLDVGYLPQEREHDYKLDLRLKNSSIPLIATYGKLGDLDYSEAGRIVMGSDSFTVGNLQPDKPLTIVMRTSRKVSGRIFVGRQMARIESLELDEHLSLRIFVDDAEVEIPPLNLTGMGYKECLIRIPARFIKENEVRVLIGGDHIAYAYWFYQ